jgi:hypothetical protein
MKDSLLKKEFKKSDVERLRNLISNKHGDSTKTQVGSNQFSSISIHKEGDIWEENGKTWTISNGLRMNLSKLETIKHLIHIPNFCPNCNKLLNHINDKKFYIFHKKCSDCVIKFETELKRLGKYDEYEKNIMKNNIVSYIEDLESKFNHFISDNTTFMSEQGDIEDWHGDNNKQPLIDEFSKYISLLKSHFDIS